MVIHWFFAEMHFFIFCVFTLLSADQTFSIPAVNLFDWRVRRESFTSIQVVEVLQLWVTYCYSVCEKKPNQTWGPRRFRTSSNQSVAAPKQWKSMEYQQDVSIDALWNNIKRQQQQQQHTKRTDTLFWFGFLNSSVKLRPIILKSTALAWAPSPLPVLICGHNSEQKSSFLGVRLQVVHLFRS